MEVSLKVIALASIIYLFISFGGLHAKDRKVIEMLRIMDCVFFLSIFCMALSGLTSY